MQPFSGNQRPDLRTSLMNMSLVLRLARKMHVCRSSSNAARLPTFLKRLQFIYVLFTLDKVHKSWRMPLETTPGRPKLVQTRQFLTLLSLKCALRHDAVHFFNSSTSKSGVRESFFSLLISTCASCRNGVHFFNISSSKSVLRSVCFVFPNVLRATTMCTFRHLNF